GLDLVAGAAHDVAARRGERVDLGEGALDVRRAGGGHRLDRHRCVPAHRDIAHLDLASRASREGDGSCVHGAEATRPPGPLTGAPGAQRLTPRVRSMKIARSPTVTSTTTTP